MIAAGFENVDAGFLRDFAIVIVALLGAALTVKKLFWPQVVSPQPLIVALEKEFVGKHEFEKFEKYVHTSNHSTNGELQALRLAGENRDELLSALDERTKSQMRSIDNLSLKIDRVVDRVSDKVEALLRNGGGHHK